METLEDRVVRVRVYCWLNAGVGLYEWSSGTAIMPGLRSLEIDENWPRMTRWVRVLDLRRWRGPTITAAVGLPSCWCQLQWPTIASSQLDRLLPFYQLFDTVYRSAYHMFSFFDSLRKHNKVLFISARHRLWGPPRTPQCKAYTYTRNKRCLSLPTLFNKPIDFKSQPEKKELKTKILRIVRSTDIQQCNDIFRSSWLV